MKYFLTVLAVVIILVVTIVLLARSNETKSTPPLNLNSYSNSTSDVSVTVTGALVAEENRQAFKITINQNSRTIDALSGYEQTVSNTQSFPNTPAAYEVFLQGLQTAGFLSSKTTNQPNYFSVCPLGDTFQYELENNGKTLSNLWTTSCFVAGGNFTGSGLTNIPQYYSVY
jgi:hypothetical protein